MEFYIIFRKYHSPLLPFPLVDKGLRYHLGRTAYVRNYLVITSQKRFWQDLLIAIFIFQENHSTENLILNVILGKLSKNSANF